MGYRSDVALVLSKKGRDDFFRYLSEMLKSLEPDKSNLDYESIKDSIEECSDLMLNQGKTLVNTNTSAKLWVWESIKWSISNNIAELKKEKATVVINSILTDISPDDYLFMRMGEDYEDVEVKGNFWNNPFHLMIEREFSYVDPAEKAKDTSMEGYD